MGIKGAFQPDAMGTNKYKFAPLGLVAITVSSISGIEQAIDKVELPDRTTVTGGNSKPVEFTIMTPMHHTLEHYALEAWYSEAIDPVSLTYKKVCTLQVISPSGQLVRTYLLQGCWLSNRKLPEFSMESEGEIALAEWTVNADSCQILT